jgi:hypothetical protein
MGSIRPAKGLRLKYRVIISPVGQETGVRSKLEGTVDLLRSIKLYLNSN